MSSFTTVSRASTPDLSVINPLLWRIQDILVFFFFSSRRRHTRYIGDWSSDVCSSDLPKGSVIAVSGPGGSMKTSLALYILLKNRAAGRRGVYVTVEESRDSILRTMRHLGLGKEDDFLVDIARLRIEREGAEDIRDWLRVLKEFLVRRYQRERFDLLVIDTMDVLASMAHLEDARNELFHFFHFLRSMGVTTYAIANVEPAGGGISHDV